MIVQFEPFILNIHKFLKKSSAQEKTLKTSENGHLLRGIPKTAQFDTNKQSL